MTRSSKRFSSHGEIQDQLQTILASMPEEFDDSVGRRVCKLMTVVTMISLGEELEPEDEEMASEMVRLMHTSTHKSPRLTVMLALNCLTSLDIMTRSMGMDSDRRAEFTSRVIIAASRVARDHILMEDSSYGSAATH